MNQSTSISRAVVEALVRGGVRHVVLSPGSRSAGLAVTLHEAERLGLLRLHVRIDERSAAFLALGLVKGGRRPAAVVTTSGTAVANLHPALLEAWHGGVPVIAITADRPAALRGTGANQTTDQVGIFGPQIGTADVSDADAAAAAIGEAIARRGPSHVNVQFSEPLVPDEMPVDLSGIEPMPWADRLPPRQARADGSVVLAPGPKTVVVAGDDAGPPARLLAERAGWPLLAEPTSGSRNGDNTIRVYRLLLTMPLAREIERVVVTGHPTLSRPVTRLISRRDIEVLAVPGPAGIVTDPGHVAKALSAMPSASGRDEADWLARWKQADVGLSARLDALVADDPDAEPYRVARAVAAAAIDEAMLFVGSSHPVRDLDLMAPPNRVGARRLVIGNRGLAGIDGSVSTAIGAAIGRKSSRGLAFIGDLTFLHDANALLRGRGEPEPDLTIVVANDNGGSIFATLEQGDDAYVNSFERVFGTPHAVDLAALCAASGTSFTRVSNAEELASLLNQGGGGLHVVEVPIPRAGRRRIDQRIRELAGATQ